MDKIFKKKIMILGASYSQIPLIEAAKRLGYRTIVASIPGEYRGFTYADEIAYVDITDPEAVLDAAQKWDIDGIATCCMDVGIRSLGYVCEKMGLPGLNIAAAQASCDKFIEKEAYIRCGVNTAKYFRVHNEQELGQALEKLDFPVMVKAVDLMGSRGIFRSDTREEAMANYKKTMEATGRDYCIVEEFIDGTMFGVEAMISHGKLAYVLPMGNDLLQGNPPFPIGHYVPWEHEQLLQEQVREQVERVADALGFDNCAMDLDCMLKDGRIYVIEATGRAGATCITDTVSIYYGIDYYEAIVQAAMGVDVCAMFQTKDFPGTPSVTRLLSASKSGIVEEITVPERLPDEVTDLSFNIERGSFVQPMTNGRDRIGQLIVKGDTLEKCYDVLNQMLREIRLTIGPC